MATAARRRRGQRNEARSCSQLQVLSPREALDWRAAVAAVAAAASARAIHRLEAEAVRSPEELGALPGGDSPPASLRSVLLDSLLFYWGRNELRREGTWELMGPVLAVPETICPGELLTGSS